MAIDVADSRVPCPGGHLFVRRWRPVQSECAPIILLHDSLGCTELWRHFPAALAEATSRTVISYDRLGFGRSTARQVLPSIDFIDEEAEIYVPALLHGLGVTDFVAFGHSVGGAMALVLAALRANQCEAVITEAAQAFVEPRTLAGIEAANLSFQNPEQFARLVRLHGAKAHWVLDAWTKVWLSPKFRDWSLDPCLSGVHCPALVIHGGMDEFGSVAFPQRIVRGVRGPSRLEILPDCGHVPHREQQEAVLRVTAEVLQLARPRGECAS